ncbi:MAG: JAB domain-containing protein [Cyclobacteriaceae bacterium]
MKNLAETSNSKFSVSEISISYNPKVRNSDREKITCSQDCYRIVRPFFESIINYKESFYAMFLNRRHCVLGVSKISEGGIFGTMVDPKLIFQTALKAHASAIVVFHNHPSGNLKPSEADIKLTQKLKDAGNFLDLPLLDHIILTDESYYSFCDEGIMN